MTEKPSLHNNKIEKSKILFVEGNDEVKFFESLFKQWNPEISGLIQIVEYGGKDRLDPFLSMLSKTEHFIENATSIAITRDSDRSKNAAIDSINSTIRKLFGHSPISQASFKQKDELKVGIFVLPGEQDGGELEDLILESLNGNPITNLVESYLENLKKITKPEDVSSTFHFPKKPSKAKIQIYFSSMKESDPRTGICAQRKHIDFTHPCFDKIKRFLEEL